MKFRISVRSAAVFLALFGFQAACPRLASALTVAQLMENIREANHDTETVRAKVVQTIEVEDQDEELRFEGSIALKRPNFVRVDYFAPSAYTLISNGETIYVKDAETGDEETAPYDPRRVPFDLSLLDEPEEGRVQSLRDRFTLRTLEEESVDGVECYLLHLDPKKEAEEEGERGRWIWFDKKRLLPVRVRFSREAEGAEITVTLALSDLEINPELDKDAFRIPVENKGCGGFPECPETDPDNS